MELQEQLDIAPRKSALRVSEEVQVIQKFEMKFPRTAETQYDSVVSDITEETTEH